ncbi:MAG TPA: cellulase family glycosylhydrolase [Ideonella sp.]|nr:cellulase family glycosylhydrolase [Ideonella sp.]
MLAALLLGAACATAGAATPAAPVQPAGRVSVQDGKTLLRDCRPWVPHGLSFFGRVIPKGWKSDTGTMAAQAAFGPANLAQAKDWQSDVVRFQMGLPFLDPQSPNFAAGYAAELADAVSAARREGLTVVLSMKPQGRTNLKAPETMPGEASLRAWQKLGPLFAADLGVVYELFNEPHSARLPSAAEWDAWRQGHQAIIDALRRAAVPNVLFIDGLNGGRTLQGAPALRDPLGQLAYAVHPYLRGDLNTPAEWDRSFGNFAASHPLVVTEWTHLAANCRGADGAAAQAFVSYLERKRIGLIAYGLDSADNRLSVPGAGRQAPTRFEGQACSAPGAGPGEDIQRMFSRQTALAEKARPVAACGLPSGRAGP